jgi:uncharacterized protein (TIGR03118 family)
MDFSLSSRKKATPARQRPYRLFLECLEDRCLLSGGFAQVDLASNVPGWARVTDPNLVNPWGIAYSPTGPFWFGDNGSGVSDLLDGRGQPVPLVVTIPSATRWGSSPTGTVFNGGAGFAISENGVSAPSRFLFAAQDGTISGWTSVVDPTRALVAVNNASSWADYTGLALATSAGQSFLYAADFSHRTIDVFDQDFRPVVRPGSFQDPNLPRGFAPFNIQNINNLLFVTYAQKSAHGSDVVAGAGHGFIDVYDASGTLVRRFASGGALNAPWGLALAPADFGGFGGALLAGNNGDGLINAYDPVSGAFLGDIEDTSGKPIAIPNLWALTFGNGHAGGDSETLFFTAGLDYESHGLFGAIQSPEKRGADTAGSGVFDPHAPGETGDYPLPPRDGPAFLVSNEAPPIPMADLLPLRASSLALVPTLSPLVQPGGWIEQAAHFSQRAWSAHNDAVALNAFLDLNAARTVPENAGGQEQDSSREATATRGAAPVDRYTPAEGVLAGRDTEKREARSSPVQDPEALPPADQSGEVDPLVASPEHCESVAERAGEKEAIENRTGAGWTKLMKLLFLAGVPVIWICWDMHQTRSRRVSGKPAGSDPPGMQPDLSP